MSLKIVSVICFNILFLFSCGCMSWMTLNKPNKEIEINSVKWQLPEKPVLKPVEFLRMPTGFFLTRTNAIYLADNIDEMKSYISKLEKLLEEVQKHNKGE